MSKLDLIREKIINTSKDEKLVRALIVGLKNDEYVESKLELIGDRVSDLDSNINSKLDSIISKLDSLESDLDTIRGEIR